uniref:ATP-dependent DNA helicase n=1 Tax=Tanacetum cinerariifolium TaxID=118510 RepID=A0A6L2JPL7_TANCI|nr:ATP-dependent DNA helicase PIF1-like [Tanacetum cinerariifolium]
MPEMELHLRQEEPRYPIITSVHRRTNVPTVTGPCELRLLFERTNASQYNKPNVVAALITNDFGNGIPSRDIIVNKLHSGPKRISELHPAYMDLQYPLLFPYGEDDFHEKMPYYTNSRRRKTNRGFMTMKEYYSCIIHQRNDQGYTLVRGGRLFQQYLVDAYSFVEEQRLIWTRNNQDMLRVDLYHNVCDVVTRGDTNAAGLGQRIVLPGTFIGGPRYMMQNYQDAMALCLVYVIEFQKRGLPHTHILLWLEENSKCKTAAQIDNIISAELPSLTKDPDGYKVVTDYMLHGPCGKDEKYAPCTIEGPDRATTVIQENVRKGDHVTSEKIVAVDEINNYLNCRYLAPCEAVWRLFSFDIHYSFTSVMKLNFHLPNQNPVTLRDLEFLPVLLEKEGSTGKTFLYNTIIARLRTERKIVLAVASSGRTLYSYLLKNKELGHNSPSPVCKFETGVAALLLPSGRTTHSRFIIPLELLENSTCGIKQNTHLAELMQKGQLIIWDEAPMTQKYAFEALDKKLRDILGFPKPEKREQIFGGMTVLLGGDFKQILPVITKGKRPDVVQACINRSKLWKHCNVFTLNRSMRVNEYYPNGEIDNRKQYFNQWVPSVGNGTMPAKAKEGEDEPGWIQIPDQFIINSSDSPIEAIVGETYPNFIERQHDKEYLKEWAILTPRNDDVDEINTYMFKKLSGKSVKYNKMRFVKHR